MDLINKEQTYQILSEYYHHTGTLQHMALREALDRVPVVDVEPVRHGKWMLEQEKSDGYGNWNRWSCSCCGYVRTKGWAATSEGHKPQARFCENCGARMDEMKDEYVILHHEDIHFIDEDAKKAFYESLEKREE